MPAAVIASLAKKAGVSVDRAEDAWAKIKAAVVGAKLKSGGTIPADSSKWTDDMWAYVMGAFKRAVKGMGESVLSLTDSSVLIECVARGDDPSDVVEYVTEAKATPKDAKQCAKEIAKAMGGKVAGSKRGFGTTITGVEKSKAKALGGYLKGGGYEDVTKKPVYRQLVSHLDTKQAWVFAKPDEGISVRVAVVDEMADSTGKVVKMKDLLINVLYD